MINTLEEALIRIQELEKENERLKTEVEQLKARNFGGRKKHNETWTASYKNFVDKYEAGMTIKEIVDIGEISRRTAYRYKAYYDKIKTTSIICSDQTEKSSSCDCESADALSE